MNSVRNPVQAAQAALGDRASCWPPTAGATSSPTPGGWASCTSSGTTRSGAPGAASGSPTTTAPRPRRRAWTATCHRNHMHFSLSWNGAIGRTSFWSRHVFAATDYGPCRTRDLNWSGNYSSFNSHRCPRYPKVTAPARSSAAMKGLVSYSGASLFPGMARRPVTAVQRALRQCRSPDATTPATVAAVKRFKQAHRHAGQQPHRATAPGARCWRSTSRRPSRRIRALDRAPARRVR